jgi:hypothetical protein
MSDERRWTIYHYRGGEVTSTRREGVENTEIVEAVKVVPASEVERLQAALEEKGQQVALWEARFDAWQNWRLDEMLQAYESGMSPEERAEDLARRRSTPSSSPAPEGDGP